MEKIVFDRLNAWYSFRSRDKYNVQRYPTLAMFKNGVLMDKH